MGKGLRWMCTAVALICLCCMAAVGAGAEEAPETAEVICESVEVSAEGTPVGTMSSDALAEQYIQRMLTGKGATLRALNPVGDTLTGYDRTLYLKLKAVMEEIAAGERSSTELTYTFMDLCGQNVFTAEELGVADQQLDGLSRDEQWAIVWDAFQEEVIQKISFMNVIPALMNDYPMGMYWYDKTRSSEMSMSYSPFYDQNSRTVRLSQDVISIKLPVSEDYAVKTNGVPERYQVDPVYGESVSAAAATAQAIVDEYESLGNYERLLAYKNRICALTDYNQAAADDDSTPYGNPWQPVWVFDGDPDTTVVCEGYAKAFKLLNDLSAGTAEVICVSGNLSVHAAHGGSSGGPHMWNVVTMEDGYNYLADVTNCDEGSVGYVNQLFMQGWSEPLPQGEGYVFRMTSGQDVWYQYQEECPADKRELSSISYPERASGTIHHQWISAETAGVTGRDVTVHILQQPRFGNAYFEIDYKGPNGDEPGGWELDPRNTFTVIGTNFLEPGEYELRLYRVRNDDFENMVLLETAPFTMEYAEPLPPPVITLNESYNAGDPIRFTVAGAEATASQHWFQDPETGEYTSGTNPPLTNYINGTNGRLGVQPEEMGLLSGYVWARYNGRWSLPAEIHTTVVPRGTLAAPTVTRNGEAVGDTLMLQAFQSKTLDVSAPDAERIWWELTDITDPENEEWITAPTIGGTTGSIDLSEYFEGGKVYRLRVMSQRLYYQSGETTIQVVCWDPEVPETLTPGEDVVIVHPAMEGATGYSVGVWGLQSCAYEETRTEAGTFTIPAAVFSEGGFFNIGIGVANEEQGDWLWKDTQYNDVAAWTGCAALTATPVSETVPGWQQAAVTLSVDEPERVLVQFKRVYEEFGGDWDWEFLADLDHPGTTVFPLADLPSWTEEWTEEDGDTFRFCALKNGNWTAWSDPVTFQTGAAPELEFEPTLEVDSCIYYLEGGEAPMTLENEKLQQDCFINAYQLKNATEVRRMLAGDPVFTKTVEGTAGFDLWQVTTINAPVARIALVTFPETPETDIIHLRCEWDGVVWEQDFTVEFRTVPANGVPQGVEIRFDEPLVFEAGTAFTPSQMMRFSNGWVNQDEGAETTVQLLYGDTLSTLYYAWNEAGTSPVTGETQYTINTPGNYLGMTEIFSGKFIWRHVFEMIVVDPDAPVTELVIGRNLYDEVLYYTGVPVNDGAKGRLAQESDAAWFSIENPEDFEEGAVPRWTLEILEGRTDLLTGNAEGYDYFVEMPAGLVPETPEQIRFKVGCRLGSGKWSREFTLKVVNPVSLPEGITLPVEEGEDWTVNIGEPIVFDTLSDFANGWTNPLNSEKYATLGLSDPSLVDQFELMNDGEAVCATAAGSYPVEVVVTNGRLYWSEPIRLTVLNEDGSRPTDIYGYRMRAETEMLLPEGLIGIEAEAMEGIAAERIVINGECASIGPRAFASNDGLIEIVIPAGMDPANIDDTAFEGCENAVVITGSEAIRSWAAAHGLMVVRSLENVQPD